MRGCTSAGAELDARGAVMAGDPRCGGEPRGFSVTPVGFGRTRGHRPRGIDSRRSFLIDERMGAKLALERGLTVTGTLGVLDLASRAGLLRLQDVFPRLQKINFRCPPSLIEKLIQEEKER